MSLRIVITTTLNDNLFHAKIVPLVRSRPDIELVVVSDRQGPQYERIKWVWPQGVMATMGRLGGRLPLLAREVFHPRTRLVMAYSVIPHGLFALLYSKLRRVPIYLHYIAGPAEVRFAHSVETSDNRVVLKSRKPERLEKIADRVGRAADRVFVPGSNTARFLTEIGYDPRRIVQLHSTVDPERYYSSDAPRDIDVLVAAQLRARKRPLFTLEIFREILNRRPQTKFCWLGDGLMNREFDEAIDRLGLRDALLWTHTNDVAPFYRRAKVFLLCSINEGLSLASMEALRCGTVPVTTDCGDMSDLVRTGEIGELLPIEASCEEFVRATLQFLDDQQLWARHSAAAQEIIAREHSFPSAMRAWNELLEPFARS
jgi:glycosyltransferase involved in cell wall biosynthesis